MVVFVIINSVPKVFSHAVHQPIRSFLKTQKHKTAPFPPFTHFYEKSLCRCAEQGVFSRFWMRERIAHLLQRNILEESADSERTNSVPLWTVPQILRHRYLYAHTRVFLCAGEVRAMLEIFVNLDPPSMEMLILLSF